jgi:hypothetical protein
LTCTRKPYTAEVINCWNEKLGEITFENKPAAFDELIAYVKQFKKRGMTPVYGLEDVGGYGRSLAVYLLENKQKVKEVNSALSYAERKSYPTTQKSDSWDAECVAKILQTSWTFCRTQTRKTCTGRLVNW